MTRTRYKAMALLVVTVATSRAFAQAPRPAEPDVAARNRAVLPELRLWRR